MYLRAKLKKKTLIAGGYNITFVRFSRHLRCNRWNAAVVACFQFDHDESVLCKTKWHSDLAYEFSRYENSKLRQCICVC